MDLLVAWVVFPVVLGLLATGCGLLVERVAGHRFPMAVVPGLGVALIAIVGQFSTLSSQTARLTTPIVAALAVAGFGLAGLSRQRVRPDVWSLACVASVFAVFAAPIVLSGEATFAGYIRLDDTASWLALTERAMSDGASAAGLAPSTYEATLDFYLNSRYPLGGLVPLGVAGELVGQDYAWVWQPYLAFLAVMLASTLYVLATPLIASRPLRAAAAFTASQAALVLGFALWGGFKEVAAAWLVALLGVLAPSVVRDQLHGRRLLPLAVVSAAVLAVLSSGGAVWLVPAFLPIVVAALRRADRSGVAKQAAWLGGSTLLLAAPSLATVSFLGAPAASTITDRDRLANLITPLSELQVFGIWPSGDFRLRPDQLTATYILIALAALGGVMGIYWAVKRRDWELLLYLGAVSGGGLLVVLFGSPWITAKALAVASPAFVLLALIGALWLAGHGRLIAAGLLAAAIVGGVGWSNYRAYRDVNLAPRDRLVELERINERFSGMGPTLMTEFEPYGARYFLRDMDPESAGELRRRPVNLRTGGRVGKGGYADLDEFRLEEVLVYRTIVLRRSPTTSRPPSSYRRAWSGRHYEVWQRPEAPASEVVEHLPLGNPFQPVETPSCGDASRLSDRAGAGTALFAVPRTPVGILGLTREALPPGWTPDSRTEGAARPSTPGSVELTVTIPRPGDYEVWVGGSIRGELTVSIDDRPVGKARHVLNNFGQYVSLGTSSLGPGRHAVALSYGADDFHPGSGGPPAAVGPVIISPFPPSAEVVSSPEDAPCDRPLDWIELVRPGPQ